MKRARQAEILNVIRMMDVETQEQLLEELKKGELKGCVIE